MSNEKMVKVGGQEMPLEVLNDTIITDLKDSGVGLCKKASDLSSAYLIKMIVREDGFLRKILPAEQIGEQDLDNFEVADKIGKIITIEPVGFPSASLPIGNMNSTDVQYYYTSKAVVNFFDVKTPHFQKNIYQLMTYKNIDLRKVVVDNALKDMQKQEDAGFIAGIDTLCAANAGNVFEFSGGLNRDTWVETSKIMGKKMLHNGIALMNDATVREFGKLNRNEWGGDGSQKVWEGGLAAGMGDGKLFGMNILSTLKADIINDNMVYLFTEPDYLGKLYELQKPTLYVKRTEDIITVNATEKIGTLVANTAGVAKVKYLKATTFTNSDYPIPSDPVAGV